MSETKTGNPCQHVPGSPISLERSDKGTNYLSDCKINLASSSEITPASILAEVISVNFGKNFGKNK